MKIQEHLSEDAFIPINNTDGGQRGHSVSGKVVHFLVKKQNTTINPKWMAMCGKILLGFDVNRVSKSCKKCDKLLKEKYGW